jgi:hypothetical protein
MTEVTGLFVDWHAGMGNFPRLVLSVTEQPVISDCRFVTDKHSRKARAAVVLRAMRKEKEPTPPPATTYYGMHQSVEGLVYFLWHDPQCQLGFGGSSFQLTLINGETVNVLGPWSSNAMHVNSMFEPHCIEVIIHAEYLMAGWAMQIPSVLSLMHHYTLGVSLVRIYHEYNTRQVDNTPVTLENLSHQPEPVAYVPVINTMTLAESQEAKNANHWRANLPSAWTGRSKPR